MELEKLAEKLQNLDNLSDQEKYLFAQGRERHIDATKEGAENLSKENPKLFIRVGSQVVPKEEFDTNEEYEKTCIKRAKYLYEKFPIIFEFYDELTSSQTPEE